MNRNRKHHETSKHSPRPLSGSKQKTPIVLRNPSRPITPAPQTTAAVAAPSGSMNIGREKALEGILDRHQRKRTAAAPIKSKRLYAQQTKRPLISLLFVLPFILVYEIATLACQDQTVRSGMDQWLVHFFSRCGLGELIILPVVTTGLLLAAHHLRGDNWQYRPTTLGWMVIESFGLGLILFWAAKAVYLISCDPRLAVSATTSFANPDGWRQTVALIGSGIYEELIFRLILLTFMTRLLFAWLQIRQVNCIAMVVVSLIFACLHYDFFNPAGAPFELASFVFRFMASIIFSLLFLYRGFGIAVGAHIAFDVLTQLQ
jgi:membrane protease YdiL (CAAX protease family)